MSHTPFARRSRSDGHSLVLVIVLVFAVWICVWLPVGAVAAQTATIDAKFSPERLGAGTALSLGFRLRPQNGHVPEALSAVHLAYPANLGLATSGLGAAACAPSVLEVLGGVGCPANSRMGSGSAVVEFPLSTDTIKEHVSLELFAGPSPDGYLHILVYASGTFPVYAQVILAGVLLRGQMSVIVPPIPSVPEAAYIAMTQMQMTLGGNLTYYEVVRGRSRAYHPAGVGLPLTCPSGGFAFAASFAFLSGGHANAHTAVPCPRRR